MGSNDSENPDGPMSIEFNCQSCGKLLRVPDGSGGKQAKCPHCEAIMHIPHAQGDVPASPLAPQGGSMPDPQATRDQTASQPTDELFGSTIDDDDPLGLGSSTTDPLQQPTQQSPEPHYGHAIADPAGGYGGGQPAQSTYPDTTAGYGGGHNPYHAPQPAGGYAAPIGVPHRGGMVLTFGILSICFSAIGSPSACGPLVCCYVPTLFLVLGIGFGIPPWMMGRRDLNLIAMGQMDPSGHGMTKAGMITGMIGVILAIVCGVLCVVVSVLMFLPSVLGAP